MRASELNAIAINRATHVSHCVLWASEKQTTFQFLVDPVRLKHIAKPSHEILQVGRGIWGILSVSDRVLRPIDAEDKLSATVRDPHSHNV